MPKSKHRKKPQYRLVPVGPITAEELMYAVGVGGAAYVGKTPRPSLVAQGEADIENRRLEGPRLVLSDHPLNHFSISILEAFKDDKPKGRDVLFRALLWFNVVDDPGFLEWIQGGEIPKEGPGHISSYLAEAMATIPVKDILRGPEPRQIFEYARKLMLADGAAP